MSNELFPPASVTMDSPRLSWLKKHGLVLVPMGELGGTECPETGDDIPHWVCRTLEPTFGQHWPPRDIGGGDTADEACAEVARNRGIPLWNETP